MRRMRRADRWWPLAAGASTADSLCRTAYNLRNSIDTLARRRWRECLFIDQPENNVKQSRISALFSSEHQPYFVFPKTVSNTLGPTEVVPLSSPPSPFPLVPFHLHHPPSASLSVLLPSPTVRSLPPTPYPSCAAPPVSGARQLGLRTRVWHLGFARPRRFAVPPV